MGISWRHAGLSATAEYSEFQETAGEFQETAGGLGDGVMSCQFTGLSHACHTL